ncbi:MULTISPECIES: F0F1 ATP synthase subunit B [Paenibacillus]|uniref:ATP synthase subunit b n=1 Tax=Paenibacillus campinasensis TaxID=66347 RepID=A0A268EVS8_9BACL|nr:MULTISPECIES: F0F1 ATP synthase subunit B [Paenibacillus]MUG67522.1 F0F1 ATP synthase subunit B [Paenibacillus campinasensis]PAD77236.1 ATP synthase F0 subunit B [Paenibacillus campinasensis]PAK51938.1 ATP synthase F0 subunit B [Paenibacillus sp. 7541]
MEVLWENILISIVAFAILYFLLHKYAFSKLFAIMEQRRELVMNQMNEAAETRKQAALYVEEQKKALDQARQEAHEIIERSRQTSNKQAEQLIEQAKEETVRLKAEAVRDIENEKNKAVEELRGELGSVSVKIASKLIEREVKTDEAQEQLVDQYLKEVGGRS